MKQVIKNLEDVIRETVASRLQEYMGERSVKAYSAFFNNALTICLTDVFSPAEEHFAVNRDNMECIQSLKGRQFDAIKPQLSRDIQEVCGEKIREVNSFVTENAERFVVIHFRK